MKKLRLSKTLWERVFLLIVALLICAPLWMQGTIWGHDLGFHLYRLAGLENALRDGQIVPQVDPKLLYGAGYGFNLFYGPLVAWIALIGKVVLGSWVGGVNFLILVCVYGGGLAVLKLTKEISKKRYLGIMTATIYMLAPYHLTDIYVRSAFGEVTTFFLAPMLFLGLWRLVEKKEKYLLWTVIGAAGMLLTHNLSVVIFGLLAGVFLLFNGWKLLDIAVIRRLLISAVVALGISSVFWIPFGELRLTTGYNIFEQNYQQILMAQNGQFFDFSALTLKRLFWDDRVTGGAGNVMAFGIGVMAIVGLVGFWIMYPRMKKEEKNWGRAMWGGALIMMLLASDLIPWEKLAGTPLRVFFMLQFPWRMLLAGSFCLSIVSGLVVYYLWDLIPKQREAVMAGAVWVTLGFAMLGSSQYIAYALRPDFTMREWRHDYEGDNWGTAQNSWMSQYVPVRMNRVEVGAGADALVEEMEEWLRDKRVEVVEGEGEVVSYEKEGTRVRMRLASVKIEPQTLVPPDSLISERSPAEQVSVVNNFGGESLEDLSATNHSTLDESSSTIAIELPLTYYPGYKSSKGEVMESENGLVLVRMENVEVGKEYEVEVWYGMSGGTVVGLIVTILCSSKLVFSLLKVSSTAREVKSDLKKN